MKALADALVYAVTYINCLPDPAEEHLDDDVGALEGIATFLHNATEEEKDALAAAVRHAFEAEQAGPQRSGFLRDYGSWMEDVFGDGWEGNERVSMTYLERLQLKELAPVDQICGCTPTSGCALTNGAFAVDATARYALPCTFGCFGSTLPVPLRFRCGFRAGRNGRQSHGRIREHV